MFVEVLDVRSGGEGFISGSRDDHGPDIAVSVQLLQDVGKFMPHGEADGIPLAGAVEGDCGHGGLGVEKDLVVQDVGVPVIR